MSLEEEIRRDYPGLESYIYNFAYIFKYAKTHNIDMGLYTDDSCTKKNYEECDTPNDWYGFFTYYFSDEMKNDELLKLAIDGFKGNYSEINYEGLYKFFDEMSIDELTNIAQLNIDTSIYNMGTPDSISELAIGLLESENYEHRSKVLDLGTYNGDFLVSYALSNINHFYEGIEINRQSCDITKLRLGLLGVNGFVRFADEFLCGNEPNYDKVFSNHPFMSKATEHIMTTINNTNDLDYKFNTFVSPDWFFVEKARQFTSPIGKAVCVVLDSSLTKKTDSYIRKRLIEEGWIEAIISLPTKAFPYSSISSSIVVLSRDNKEVKMIDASDLYDAERRINKIRVKDVINLYMSKKSSVHNKTVSVDEICKNEFMLNVKNYLDNYKIALINPVPLESVCENIFRGYQISAKEMDINYKTDNYVKKYRVLNVGNINDGVIDYLLDSVYVEKNNLDRYVIKNGDIVLSCKSSKLKIALFESKDGEDVLASGNLIVIRPDKNKILPAYLKMFLDSEKGNRLLNSIQTGASIISINPSALKEMNIPLLDIDTQAKISNLYMSKIDTINMYRKKIFELEDEIKSFSNNSF